MNTPNPSSPVEETKKSTPPPSTSDAIKGGILLTIIVSLGIWFFVGGEPSQPSSPVVGNASAHTPFVYDHVKAQASHPSTVEFCSTLNLMKKTETEPDGSYLHAYRNCMTAKNSYGTELKYDWVVVLHEKLDGTIEVIETDIKEE